MTDYPLADPSESNGSFADALGGMSMQDLMEQAAAMQAQLAEAQARSAETEVVGTSGNGAVQVTVTGGMEFLALKISPEVVDPSDVELLEDLVLAALHDAVNQAAAVNQEMMSAFGGLGDFDNDSDLES